MTDTEAAQQAMERIRQRSQRAIKRALVIPQEPSPLPPPDDPLYELNLLLHRIIALQRQRRREAQPARWTKRYVSSTVGRRSGMPGKNHHIHGMMPP